MCDKPALYVQQADVKCFNKKTVKLDYFLLLCNHYW